MIDSVNCTQHGSVFEKVQKEMLSVNTAQQGAQDEIRFSESTIPSFKPDTKIVSYYFIKVNLTMVAGSREMRQNLGINNFLQLFVLASLGLLLQSCSPQQNSKT